MTGTALLAVLLWLLSGCATTEKKPLGIRDDGRLAPCPSTPNCVSSDAPRGDAHYIEPLRTGDDPDAVWQALIAYLERRSAFTIVERRDDYLRAEARTRVLRFVDDVEFHLRPAEREIAMRSASRIGYSDLGANRRRLEALREALAGPSGDGDTALRRPPP
jgi:uncharacterized protein (DUF1499 family)